MSWLQRSSKSRLCRAQGAVAASLLGAKQRGSGWTAASLSNCSVRCLELLDQSDIHEPSQVIIGATRNSEGVAKLEPKLLGWVFTEYIIHSHGDGGVVQDILPARHTVNSRRRHFLALFAADHFLTAF